MGEEKALGKCSLSHVKTRLLLLLLLLLPIVQQRRAVIATRMANTPNRMAKSPGSQSTPASLTSTRCVCLGGGGKTAANHRGDPCRQFPLFQHALPLLRLAEVHAGDVLYLPSLWLHHVEQRRAADGRPCIALNWW
jgi:hypothetical protein